MPPVEGYGHLYIFVSKAVGKPWAWPMEQGTDPILHLGDLPCDPPPLSAPPVQGKGLPIEQKDLVGGVLPIHHRIMAGTLASRLSLLPYFL